MGDNEKNETTAVAPTPGLPPLSWRVETVTGPLGTKVRLTLSTVHGDLKFVFEGEAAIEAGTALSAAGGDASRGLQLARPSLLRAKPVF